MAILKTPPDNLKQDKKKKEGVFRRAVNLTLDQFLERTPIHGCKQIRDQRANIFQKAYWIFIICTSTLCACALLATFLIRYKSNPVRINILTNFGQISELEFPAVTFCNPNFIANSMVDGLIKSLETFNEKNEEYNNVTAEDLNKRVKYLAGFTNPIETFDPKDLVDLYNVLNDNRFDVKLTMRKLLYPCSKLLVKCRWEGQIVDCKELFQPSETYQGYCCSFNVIKPLRARTPERRNITAKKTHFFGPNMGLSVVLKPLIEKNAMTSINSEGIKILINEHNLFPSEKTIERSLPHKQETYVEIRPERTISSKEISALPISDRGCVFEDEFPLRVFGSYSEKNCRVECKMRKIVDLCDCLPYFYYNTENIETCDVTKLPCVIKNREHLVKVRRPENNTDDDCVCPVQCDTTDYRIRMSSTDIIPEMSNTINFDPFHANLTDQHMIVHVYFVSSFYRIFIRILTTNFISLISQLGGVYSLLIGMSVLSLIECIYFPTVRLYLNYKKIKFDDTQPKNYSQRLDKVTISSLNVPRLDTAKSDISDISSFRIHSVKHY
ncbi:hypothetical protein PVAND_015099 [Polypedilum vanderplanki]|uniref:Uncharacterized protein n=1 Tax=Polypedilum vanderplanki TaxID=319348 RepID=A0A9J6BB87_POLVA|nr:hypothetical protein PVAND_015099 [Polypedilum vanderplanki]